MPTPKIIPLEEEMKKNPEITMQDIEHLREWCKKQPHLPEIPDVFLAFFLQSNYFRLEPTKNTIENFFTVRTHVPELFNNRDPYADELRKAYKVVANLPLQTRTKEGYKIVYGRLLDTDPSHYNFNDCTKYFFMMADRVLVTEGTSSGFIYVTDVTGVTLGHVGRLSLMGLKKLAYYIQEAAPVRLKGLHYINSVPAMETIINMSKPFLKKELINMIHFHSTLETLKEYMPIEALPNESGGKAGPIQDLVDEQVKLMEECRDWYRKTDTTWVVNETKRVGKGKTAGDLFGVEGSFRKLEID